MNNDWQMEAREVKHTLEQMIYFVKSAEDQMKYLDQQLSMVDQEISDFYHEAGISRLNACEMAKSWMNLGDAVRRRWQIKDEQDLLKKFTDFSTDWGNEEFVKKLSGVVNHMNQRVVAIKNRKYIPRVRTDIKLAEVSE